MSDPRKFKNDIVVEGDIQLPAETANRAVIIDGSGEIASSTVTTTELELLSGATVDLADLEQDVADLVTLSGVPANSTDLGTFTGAIIPDGSDNKEALQALETAAETDATNLANHIADAVDAHDASAISVVPTGNLAADDVQEALVELQTDIDSLQALDPMEYKGAWNASTNTPTLADGLGDNGDLYYVSVAGTQDLGSGSITFEVGDKVVYNGTLAVWEKWDVSDAVSSVFGRTGAVTAQAGDYEASEVTFTPAGTIAATDVQAAIEELDGDVVAAQADATQALADAAAAQADIDAHIADTTDAHDASAISVVPTGNLASTDVQSALVELQGDIDALPVASAGDINETSFSLANNQAVAADVTGFAFANATVRGFTALVTVEIDGTADLFEQFSLQGIQKGASWNMSVDGVGDNSGVVFSITSAGQIQYTSGDVPGFVSGDIKFRAITTTV
jgi:hypothetical protein